MGKKQRELVDVLGAVQRGDYLVDLQGFLEPALAQEVLDALAAEGGDDSALILQRDAAVCEDVPHVLLDVAISLEGLGGEDGCGFSELHLAQQLPQGVHLRVIIRTRVLRFSCSSFSI